MDSKLFMLDDENGYSLILDKDEKGWFVELLNLDQKVLFHYKCDTFATGNLILHLKKAMNAFAKKHHKIVLSRWYPRIDARFLISIGPTYISPYIYMNTKDKECYVKFIVVEEIASKPITFEVQLDQLQNKIL